MCQTLPGEDAISFIILFNSKVIFFPQGCSGLRWDWGRFAVWSWGRYPGQATPEQTPGIVTDEHVTCGGTPGSPAQLRVTEAASVQPQAVSYQIHQKAAKPIHFDLVPRPQNACMENRGSFLGMGKSYFKEGIRLCLNSSPKATCAFQPKLG